MRPQTDPFELLLETLGKAHREGALVSASGRYPWQSDATETLSVRHRRWAWVRVAVPVAAAAAVAVLFVGPSLFETTAVNQIAESIPTAVLPEQPEALAEAQPNPTTTADEPVNCDYNGDGQIDGRDIQAFCDRVRETGGGAEYEAAFLRQCLIGG